MPDIITPTYLVWQAIGSPKAPIMPKTTKEELCSFCGVHRGIIRKQDVFGSGFTNFDRCANNNSNAVCPYCYHCLRSESKLRTSNWIASRSGIRYFKRNEIADILFGGKETPFCLYITTSWKKIGVIKVVVNNNPYDFVVQFEETPIAVDTNKFRELWATIQSLYSCSVEEQDKKLPKSFFTKAEIRTGQYQFHRIQAFGLLDWRTAESIIAPFRGTGILDLLLFAANQEKLGRHAIIKSKEIKRGKKENVPVSRRNDGDGNRKGQKRKKTGRKPAAKTPVGTRPDISDLACDQLGQYLLFPENENL